MIPAHGTQVVVKSSSTRGTVVGFIQRTSTVDGRRTLILQVEHEPGRVRRYTLDQLSVLAPELPPG